MQLTKVSIKNYDNISALLIKGFSYITIFAFTSLYLNILTFFKELKLNYIGVTKVTLPNFIKIEYQ